MKTSINKLMRPRLCDVNEMQNIELAERRTRGSGAGEGGRREGEAGKGERLGHVVAFLPSCLLVPLHVLRYRLLSFVTLFCDITVLCISYLCIIFIPFPSSLHLSLQPISSPFLPPPPSPPLRSLPDTPAECLARRGMCLCQCHQCQCACSFPKCSSSRGASPPPPASALTGRGVAAVLYPLTGTGGRRACRRGRRRKRVGLGAGGWGVR